MISEKRSQTARANGAMSHGPKTPEGKSRSSQNATKHGLLSRHVVLPGESEDAFDDVMNAHLTRFSPVDEFESTMIEEMAASYWRMRRTWAIERSMMAKALDRQPETDDQVAPYVGAFCELADSGRLPLLHRYEARLHQMYQRAVRTLILTRKAAPYLPESSPPAARPDLPTPEPGPEPDSITSVPASPSRPGPQPATTGVAPVPMSPSSATQNREIPNEPKKPPAPVSPQPGRRTWAQIYTIPDPEDSPPQPASQADGEPRTQP